MRVSEGAGPLEAPDAPYGWGVTEVSRRRNAGKGIFYKPFLSAFTDDRQPSLTDSAFSKKENGFALARPWTRRSTAREVWLSLFDERPQGLVGVGAREIHRLRLCLGLERLIE